MKDTGEEFRIKDHDFGNHASLDAAAFLHGFQADIAQRIGSINHPYLVDSQRAVSPDRPQSAWASAVSRPRRGTHRCVDRHQGHDVALMRVKTGDPATDPAYTIIRNKAYLNVTSMFASERDRDMTDIEHDTLTVVEGIQGSYPNFFFVVEADELEDFTSRIMAVRTRDDYERLVGIYGVRHTSDAFWETADWFQDYYAKQEPLLYGILDLNRYANR